MTGDFEKELAVATKVGEFLLERAANRNAAQDKRPGVIGKFLFAVIALFADESDGFELLEASSGDMDLR